MIKFSNVKINLFKSPYGSLIGNGTVNVANILEVKFKLMKGPKGIFASLPSTKGEKDGKTVYYNDVKIVNQEDYFEFQNVVKDAYDQMTGIKKSNPKVQEEESFQANQMNEYDEDIPF